MPSKSMSPLETLVTYKFTHTLEFVLLLYRGLRFLSLRAFTYCYLLSARYFIANYTPKTPKLLHYYCLLVKWLSNTLSSSWVRQPFLLNITTIDLLYLGAITFGYSWSRGMKNSTCKRLNT
jgi:hypothetical protein